MASKDDNQQVYRVFFQNQGQIYEVYARNIYQSELYGFVEIEDYTFGNKSQVVIDPSEEKLRNEFEGVQRSFIPMHAIVRIDEVEKEGVAKNYKDIGSRTGLTVAESDVEYVASSDNVKTVYTSKVSTDIRKLVTEGYIKIERNTLDVSISTEKASL